MSKPKNIIYNAVSAGATPSTDTTKPLTVSGYLQHYGERNLNGQTDKRGCYADWLADFNAGRIALPLVLEHKQMQGEDIIGKFTVIEDREDGLYGVAEIISTPHIDNELAPRIRAGVWPAFSTAVMVEDYENGVGWDFTVTKGYLRHVSLVATPADTSASVTIENTTQSSNTQSLNCTTMSKPKNRGELRKVLQNALSSDISDMVREAIEAAIAELESAEGDKTIEDAIAAIKSRLDGLASMEQVEAVENSLRKQMEAMGKPKSASEYLNSKQAMRDFAQAMKNQRGNAAAAMREFAAKAAENGVNDPDKVLLPAPILILLTDAMRDSWLWSKLNHTGLKAITVGWNTEDGDNPRNQLGRAGGHIPGDEKQEETIDLIGRTIRTQGIYKFIQIPWETLEEQNDDDVLIAYVSKELVRAMMYELERVVLVHDGRANNDRRHITSFMPVKTDPWTLSGNYDPAQPMDGIVDAISRLPQGGRKLVVAAQPTINKLRRRLLAAGATPTYISNEMLAEELGVAEVLACPNYDTLGAGTVLIFDADQYFTVGAREYDTLYGYDIKHNMHQYEIRQMAGGAMGTRGAAIRLTPQAVQTTTNLIQPVLQEELRAAAAVEVEAKAAKSAKSAKTVEVEAKPTATATE